MLRSTRLFRTLLSLGVALPLLGGTAVLAQGTNRTVEGRVDRLEQEMRAVQRKVFPNAAGGQVLAPEVGPAAPVPGSPAGTPATSPVADLTARVTAIEEQLARLTGQVEENGYRLKQLEENFAKLSAPPPLPAAAPIVPPPAAPAANAAPTRPQPAAAAPSPANGARNEQVAAVERPSTGNAALDGYTYGYRLWQAKFYPEAQTQLQATLDKFGSDPVASRTQNLLGRAYLDDKKPSMAAKVLYENYRVRPKGDRAPESLAWVGESLIQLNRLKEACLAYDELADVFGQTMPAGVRDMMTKGRVRAKCSA